MRIPSNQKSTSGVIFSVGSTKISWYSNKKMFVVLNSAEAKYMAISQATCEEIWMRKILVGLFGHKMDPSMIYFDNHSCIKLYENPIFHD